MNSSTMYLTNISNSPSSLALNVHPEEIVKEAEKLVGGIVADAILKKGVKAIQKHKGALLGTCVAATIALGTLAVHLYNRSNKAHAQIEALSKENNDLQKRVSSLENLVGAMGPQLPQ